MFRSEWDEYMEAVQEEEAEPEFDLESVKLNKLWRPERSSATRSRNLVGERTTI